MCIDFSVSGSFGPNCQEDSIPASLLSLVRMILWGSNVKEDEIRGSSDLTISQLLMLNSKKIGKTEVIKTEDMIRPEKLLYQYILGS